MVKRISDKYESKKNKSIDAIIGEEGNYILNYINFNVKYIVPNRLIRNLKHVAYEATNLADITANHNILSSTNKERLASLSQFHRHLEFNCFQGEGLITPEYNTPEQLKAHDDNLKAYYQSEKRLGKFFQPIQAFPDVLVDNIFIKYKKIVLDDPGFSIHSMHVRDESTQQDIQSYFTLYKIENVYEEGKRQLESVLSSSPSQRFDISGIAYRRSISQGKQSELWIQDIRKLGGNKDFVDPKPLVPEEIELPTSSNIVNTITY